MRVFYIEDNRLNLRLVQRMLKSDCEVLGATTGLGGIEQVHSINPDIILLDINLPDISGYEVHEKLREQSGLDHVPIIAVTANAMYGDRQHILDAGFDEYLAKPVTQIELRNAISKCMRKAEIA